MAKNRATFIAAGTPAFVSSAHPVSRFYCLYRLLSEELISLSSVGNEIDNLKPKTFMKSFLFYTLCSKRPVLGYLARDTDRTDGAFARCDFGRDISRLRLRRAESSSSFSHKMDFILSRRAEGYKMGKWCQAAPEIRKGNCLRSWD